MAHRAAGVLRKSGLGEDELAQVQRVGKLFAADVQLGRPQFFPAGGLEVGNDGVAFLGEAVGFFPVHALQLL
ncbi:hypothetical protein D3C84_953790 [compost metagenome]